MSGFKRPIKPKKSWMGMLVIIIPLGLLLGFQIKWLDRLKETSVVAYQAALRNYLEGVSTEVEYFYKTLAERILNVPSVAFYQKGSFKFADHWNQKPLDGVRRIFFVDYTKVSTGNFYSYSPKTRSLEPSTASNESLAIVIACLPWQARVYASVTDETTGFHVDEQDPNNRVILNPVTDELSRIVGVVAMILDEDYFRKQLLRQSANKIQHTYFTKQAKTDLRFTVWDHNQKIVLGEAIENNTVPVATSKFHYVFTDWTLDLYNLGSTPEQWAKRSFVINMTLSILLLFVLLVGVALTMRAANRAMRLSQMKSDFVSNVSHELRTPLASIRVFAEFLRLGRISSQQKVEEYGEHIELESRRLSRLIDNILDFSRIESGRKEYRFVPTQLEEVVKSVMKSYQVDTKQNGFQCSLDIPAGSLPLVEADPNAIEQALHNLLDNAIKYSRQKQSVQVRVALEEDFVVISVKDRGVGISREEQKKIFERFHRVGSGPVHDVKGSGLGLSIVRHVVESHGGNITVESEPEQGSTFFVRLPLKLADFES